MTIRAGSASRVINGELGSDLSGQLHRRFCKTIRDNLEANVLYLSSKGEQVVLVSLDLISMGAANVQRIAKDIQKATGVPAANVICFCTHTHAGPGTWQYLHDAPVDPAYIARLRQWILDAAKEAVASARPAKVGWGKGHAHVGYNRRVCWADGSHTMYGDTKQPGFTGIEGPDDPSHAVLFLVDEKGKYIAVAHNNSCHSTCMEGNDFATADFAGEARAVIRGALGPKLPVLYMQGASGDTSPWNLLHGSHRDGSRRAREIGAMLAAETLRLVYLSPVHDSPVLAHARDVLKLGVRLPSKERIKRAREIKAGGEGKFGRWEYVLAVDGALKLYEQFKDDPTDKVEVHAVRIGDFAIITNPFELYCQFGIDIKRRSPAAITAVTELANGSAGYCPTIPAQMGGGYSGDPIYWTRMEPYAGYKLVDFSATLLNKIWR